VRTGADVDLGDPDQRSLRVNTACAFAASPAIALRVSAMSVSSDIGPPVAKI
jgi:hypothetical protein